MIHQNHENASFRYEYYILGSCIPIKVKYDKTGATVSAEKPDRESHKLILKSSLLTRVSFSDEIEEINQEQFDHACKLYYLEKDLD